MPKHEKVNVRLRRDHRFFNTIVENLGSFSLDKESIDDEKSNQTIIARVDDTISELDFYKCYLQLKSGLAKTVYNDSSVKLTDVTIEYMANIMNKPLDFTMPSNAKNMVQMNLAKELGRTSKSAYSAINRLKKAGYLVVTEDNIIMPNEELQRLRVITKAHLDKVNAFPLSYALNFIIK